MTSHLFTSCEGHLFDTREPDWTSNPLRNRYSYHYRQITDVAKLKATLRAGKSTFPGGYEVFFLTKDGGLLCYDCAKSEFRNIIWSMRNRVNDGWLVNGTGNSCEYEDRETCDHCYCEVVASEYDEA